MDTRFETLKKELFINGIISIENFLGFNVPESWDNDTIDNAMDEIYAQMSDKMIEEYYQHYNI